MSSSRGSSQPRDWTQVSCIADRFFYHLSHQGSQILTDTKVNKRHCPSCVSGSTGVLPRKLVGIIFDVMHTVLYKRCLYNRAWRHRWKAVSLSDVKGTLHIQHCVCVCQGQAPDKGPGDRVFPCPTHGCPALDYFPLLSSHLFLSLSSHVHIPLFLHLDFLFFYFLCLLPFLLLPGLLSGPGTSRSSENPRRAQPSGDTLMCLGWSLSLLLPVRKQGFSPWPYAEIKLFSTWFLPLTSQVALVIKNSAVKAGDAREMGLIPGSGWSSGGGDGNPLHYYCLENPKDRGAWWAIVHTVTKDWTGLKRLTTHPCLPLALEATCEQFLELHLICTETEEYLWNKWRDTECVCRLSGSILQMYGDRCGPSALGHLKWEPCSFAETPDLLEANTSHSAPLHPQGLAQISPNAQNVWCQALTIYLCDEPLMQMASHP